MTDVFWDENAEAAYAAAKADGVHVLFYWPDGDEKILEVFEARYAADAQAVIYARQIWDRFQEDDWPPCPETWEEILAEVLNREGACMDELEVHHLEVI